MGGTTKADRLHKFRLSQCRVCGHVQKELNEDWHAAMDGLYERHYHDYRIVGRQVNFVSGKIVGRDGLAVRKLDELIGLPEEGAILDIGCGAGRFLEAFGQEKAGWKLAGYDVGDLHKDQVLAIPDARFFHGLGELPKIADRFDLITLNHVVEHLTEPVVVLREALFPLYAGDARLCLEPGRPPGFQDDRGPVRHRSRRHSANHRYDWGNGGA
jgi:SAM-dependent methyltransferase